MSSKKSPLPVEDPAKNLSLAFALGCADFFHLLSMFYLNPTKELARGLLDKSIQHDVVAIFEDTGIDETKILFEPVMEQHLQSTNETALFQQMRRDYTTLFTHPKKPLISLYEMQFRDLRDKNNMPTTLFLNQAALHSEQCYRKAGLALSNETSREPGDHIAIEAEFMAYLYTQLAAALHENEGSSEKRWEMAIEEFKPHLIGWWFDFFDSCAQSNCGIVYPWLGRAGSVFLKNYRTRTT